MPNQSNHRPFGSEGVGERALPVRHACPHADLSVTNSLLLAEEVTVAEME